MADLQPPVDATAMELHNTTSDETTLPMKCCCGSVECVFLKHNCSVLDSVEKDVHNAARMGQALLARHEAYMADAERDRTELTARIEQLEMDNKELEAKNARTIEENRNLLDQLEAMNATVSDSEGRIKSLEATLLSSQQTIRRLEGETARAEALERQLALLEQEQADLQNNLVSSREEARSAMSRWKRAERGINDLQEQVERMEKEAREEREHHIEMMSRIEKQREMEKELNTAAGRLKGAAAAKSLDHGKGGTNVVSHFVRDLLQDNANLQHGITELREMLMNSHDEIQALRDELMYHQPLGDGGDASATPTLRAELGPEELPKEPSPKISQELHIHHHYHVQKQEAKKPKKKRQGLTPGVFVPPTNSYPSTPPNGSARPALTHSRRDSRWSMLSDQPSDFAPSSLPSSPRSNRRASSLFDSMMDSLPESPTTSVDPMSPAWRAGHRKQPSNMSSRSLQVPTYFSLTGVMPNQTHPIMEEPDDAEGLPGLTTATAESTADDDISRDLENPHDEVSIGFTDTDDDGTPPPRLRKAMSHESIISLTGGLDIHTLRNRPSQLTLRHLSSAASVTASSTVTARPMLSRNDAKRSSAMLRDSYSTYGSSPSGSGRSVSNPGALSGSLKLGRWVGWRPWGGGGTASSKQEKEDSSKQFGRSPGINQAGAIPGFAEYIAASQKRVPSSKVSPDVVDRDALIEGLGE